MNEEPIAYKYFSAGYLVKDQKVFLMHHRKFDKWAPCGGKWEIGETPDQALIREWKEELNLDIEVLSAGPVAFSGDSNSTPIKLPFHIDLEREGFSVPHIGFFFYVKIKNDLDDLKLKENEVLATNWFSKESIPNLKTFDQVKALALFAIDNYPKS